MDNRIDYRLVCRTCLASEAEFYKLDARIFVDDDQKISFQECLKYCTNLENVPEFPIYICTECSTALQVAYNFMKNALEAHEILRKKLCPSTRVNGQLTGVGISENGGERKVSFRCKICSERVETKKSLKEHVKLHLDIINYCCELCQFQTKRRNSLSEHYKNTHGLQPSREQLKPRTIETQKVRGGGTNVSSTGCQFQTQQQPPEQSMSVAQFLAPTDLQQIPLDMSSVISMDPSTSNSQLIDNEFKSFGNELNLGNELSIGNEFVVMQDGTVEEVMANGVVIKYINAGEDTVALDNGLFLNNIMIQPSGNVVNIQNDGVNIINGVAECDMLPMADGAVAVGEENAVNMDFDDIIIEEKTGNEIPEVNSNNNVTEAVDVSSKQIRCKMCKSTFATQEDLKEHMLSHNEIPHFFCDNCDFYTFFKIDLTQHYKTKHRIQPSNRQLQPKNKVHYNLPEGAKKVFVCDLCIYDTPVKTILRRHYLSKHQIEATELQLRPMKVSQSNSYSEEEKSQLPMSMERVKNVRAVKRDYPHGQHCTKCNQVFYMQSKLNEHYKQHHQVGQQLHQLPTVNEPMPSNVDVEKLIACTELSTSLIATEPSGSAMPPDAIPQIVETDSIVDNILDFDFNGDTIFDDDDEENDNEEFQDLILTTDDEEEYAKESAISNGSPAAQQSPFCVQCNKKFTTYYQFENHMFVHRGLAPYRCDMCTNLYNTKRDLIRHYKAVHKILPTRDMVQAKGDKVVVPTDEGCAWNTSELEKAIPGIAFMCAKCPFEAPDVDSMKTHLCLMHGVDDENYILQKLPYECPKCIRSFDSSLRLSRHIERNHSSVTICHEAKDNNDNVSCKTCGIDLLKSELKAHETLCNRITTYECLICDLVFDSRSKLLEHKNKQHPNNFKLNNSNEQLRCKYCHNKYRSELALKLHLKRHIARKFACDQCPKVFSKRNELEDHKFTHSGQYPYGCDMCKKHFRYSYHLKRHKDCVHAGKRFACDANNCKRAFYSAEELKIHAMTHADLNCTYACKYCSEQFNLAEQLQLHAQDIHQIVLTEEELADQRC